MYLCIAEIFDGINSCQYGKGHHILYVIINTGQKILWIKLLPTRAGGEIGKNFLLVKISTYTVLAYSSTRRVYESNHVYDGVEGRGYQPRCT